MMLTTQVASQKQAFPLAGTLNRLSLSELHTKHRDSPSLPVRRNLWIKLNCAETEKLANSLILAQSCRAGSGVILLLEIEESTFAIGGSWTNSLISRKSTVGVNRAESLILWRNAQSVCWKTKGEQYSGSPEHYRYLGSAVIRNGCNNENQQVITCSQLSPLVGVKLNQQITGKEKGSAENTTLEMLPFLIHEENQRSPKLDCKIKHDSSNLRNDKNQQVAKHHIRTCETFVGQPSGASLAFLRWRRLISPCMAVTMNCPVVSPSSFTDSIASTTSCGARACTFCDLELIALLAITRFPVFMWITVYRKINEIKLLTWSTIEPNVDYTLICSMLKIAKLGSVTSTSRASNHNVTEAYTMALQHSTQTRPKFQYLFLAVPRSDVNATPHRESVTAHSEQDARRSLAGQFVLSFAGRIPAQGVCNA